MKIEQIRQKLADLNLKRRVGVNTKKMRKVELIKFIQSSEGNTPCYRSDRSSSCGQVDCAWFKDCKK